MAKDLVIFTGDILRPFSKFFLTIAGQQNRNINKLHKLFAHNIADIMQANIEVVSATNLKSRAIYANENINFSAAGWAKLTNKTKLSQETYAEFDRLYAAANLVIGFEIPPILQNYFTAKNIPYLDFIIHPARFMDDIFFAVKTNHQKYFSRLQQISFSDEKIAKFVKRHYQQAKNSFFTDEIILLLGQTNIDRSLIDEEGNIKNIMNYKNNLMQYLSRGKKIYYKKHPQLSLLKLSFCFFLWKNKIKITKQNIYDLLADKNVLEVCSISSGVNYEAKFFGKKVNYLLKPPYKVDEKSIEGYISLGNFVVTKDFWLHLLADVKYRGKKHNFLKKNYLRDFFKQDWDYKRN